MPELGLYDLRNRMMSPELGRFLQPDPIGFKGDASNLYRYCRNDPANRIDPDGLVDTSSSSNIWRRLMLWQGGGDGTVGEQLEALENAKRMSEQASSEAAFRQDPHGTGAAEGRARVLAAQKSLYRSKTLRRFDKALAHVFGKSAVYVPAQTMENAPELDTSLSAEQLYTKSALIRGLRLGSGRAAGATVKTQSGYQIYIAHDTRSDPLRTYVHELANKLSGELTGSMTTFGDRVNPLRGDIDTGAAVEREMFGE